VQSPVSKSCQVFVDKFAKMSPIFKEAKVLPWGLSNFGKTNNFVLVFS